MEKALLENLVFRHKTQREIGKELGVSQTTVRYWLGKHQLTTKHVDQRLYCRDCGETDPSEFYNTSDGYKRRKCKSCYRSYTVDRLRKYKQQAVDYKGGSCEVCGYDKCLGSLDFHHVDPKSKDPQWEQMRNWKFDRIKKELDQCMLVCKNCHGEIHWGNAPVV